MKYHVNTYGGDTEGFKKGLVKALQLSSQGTHKSLLIRIGNLANTKGIMSNVLGDKFVKKLIRDKIVKFSIPETETSISIYLEGDRTRGSDFRGGVIFCPWSTPHALAEVLQDSRASDIVHIPWTEQEKDNYIATNPDSIEV